VEKTILTWHDPAEGVLPEQKTPVLLRGQALLSKYSLGHSTVVGYRDGDRYHSKGYSWVVASTSSNIAPDDVDLWAYID
jgi:hypothetical protein